MAKETTKHSIAKEALEKDREGNRRRSHNTLFRNKNSPHVVLIIPGVRDQGDRHQNTSRILEASLADTSVVSLAYGYFHALALFLPFTKFRHIKGIREKLETLKSDKSVYRVSIIAHSFGTHILFQILEDLVDEQNNFRLDKVILCGSILKRKRAATLIKKILANSPGTTIVNERADKDFWPILAESISWKYSATGTFGINFHPVLERIIQGHHGSFFSDKHILSWALFFESNSIAVGEDYIKLHWPWKLISKPFFRIRDIMIYAFISLYFYYADADSLFGSLFFT